MLSAMIPISLVPLKTFHIPSKSEAYTYRFKSEPRLCASDCACTTKSVHLSDANVVAGLASGHGLGRLVLPHAANVTEANLMQATVCVEGQTEKPELQPNPSSEVTAEQPYTIAIFYLLGIFVV